MKRIACLLLLLAVSALAASGCAQKEARGAFEADDEIVTYQRVDPDKVQLVVSRTGNISVEPLCSAFEAQNPDVQVIYLDITGGNADYTPLLDWLAGGCVPDVVITAAGFVSEEDTARYFENLSADPIVGSYEAAALQRAATGSEIYWLPGPSDISAMLYNKTLFAQYGWRLPATFDQFVALCDRIREDTGGEVEPWNPNAKYSNELMTALEAFTYEELFGGLDNREWYNGILSGKTDFAAHMAPYADMVQTLIDHGILRREHFSYSATARGEEFAAGKIAMINMSIYDADNDAFDFGYLPFPTTKGDVGYLCGKYSCFMGITAQERTERKADALRRFAAYFSSPEGQAAYIGDSIKLSHVKGVPLTWSEDLDALRPAVAAGHMFSLLDFSDGGQSRVFLHQVALDMADGGKTGADALAAVEKRLAAPAQSAADAAPEVVAAAARDMTALETSFYIADAYRQAADADVGLIAHGEAFRGNLMRIFAGDITQDMITVFKPRSFANGSTLVKASMTGRQLLDALNHPVGNEGAAACVYACSGLVCEVAPWDEPGSKCRSAKLEDGSAIDADRLYTAAFWAGTVDEAYITETLETYDRSWEELLREKLRADGAAAPEIAGRIRLIWE